MSLERTQPAQPPVDPQLPSVVSSNSEHSTCPICSKSMAEGQECLIIAECSHPFHIPCIEDYLINHTECPVCKRPCQLNELRTFSITQKSGDIPKSTSNRSRGRGANTRHYNTRSNVRSLFHEQLNLNNSMSNQSVASPNRTSKNLIPNATISPVGNNTNDIHTNSSSIDYTEINRLIETNLAHLLQNLNLIQPPLQTQNYSLARQQNQQSTNLLNGSGMGNQPQQLEQTIPSNYFPQKKHIK